MSFKILSFDGGGMRSLITALLTENLDVEYDIIKHTDGFIGTSSGGLMALALAKGVPIANIIHVYQTMGPRIFTNNPDYETDFIDQNSCVPAKYKIEGLERIADQILGEGSLDSLEKMVLVSSYKTFPEATSQEREVVISNRLNNQYSIMPIKDAALATSAISSYFPPFKSTAFGSFMNKPSNIDGLEDAAILQSMSSNATNSISDLRLLSIGVDRYTDDQCPNSSRSITPHKADKNKADFNVRPASLHAKTLMTKPKTRAARTLGPFYYRSETNLPHAYPVDNWKNISELMTWTYDYMASKEWADTKKWVSTYWEKK